MVPVDLLHFCSPNRLVAVTPKVERLTVHTLFTITVYDKHRVLRYVRDFPLLSFQVRGPEGNEVSGISSEHMDIAVD